MNWNFTRRTFLGISLAGVASFVMDGFHGAVAKEKIDVALPRAADNYLDMRLKWKAANQARIEAYAAHRNTRRDITMSQKVQNWMTRTDANKLDVVKPKSKLLKNTVQRDNYIQPWEHSNRLDASNKAIADFGTARRAAVEAENRIPEVVKLKEEISTANALLKWDEATALNTKLTRLRGGRPNVPATVQQVVA